MPDKLIEVDFHEYHLELTHKELRELRNKLSEVIYHLDNPWWHTGEPPEILKPHEDDN